MQPKVLKTGEVFGERYRILSLVASSGFSSIYKALELETDRTVALKILRTLSDAEGQFHVDVSPDELRQRFLREAELASSLKHACTVTTYDYGQVGDDVLFLAMEYIDGQSLADALESGERMAVDRVVRIILQVLEALGEAHGRGIVHRDIKPGNIMVYERFGQQDMVKLLDFGVAKAYQSQEEDLTQAGVVVGTIRYMAPEQIRSQPLTPASDIYSLGLVTYELLTGKHPIPYSSMVEVIQRSSRPESFALPSSVLAPAKLKAAVNRMLLKDVERRYQTAGEVLDDLIAFATSIDGDTVAMGGAGSDPTLRLPATDEKESPLSLHPSQDIPTQELATRVGFGSSDSLMRVNTSEEEATTSPQMPSAKRAVAPTTESSPEGMMRGATSPDEVTTSPQVPSARPDKAAPKSEGPDDRQRRAAPAAIPLDAAPTTAPRWLVPALIVGVVIAAIIVVLAALL